MCGNHSIRISWAGLFSNYFNALNGVKQGGVISPLLFCIYIDDLLIKLSLSGVGCFIGFNFVGALAYADDIVLIAPSPSAMRTLLSICDIYAKEYDIVFNAKKSKFLAVVGSKRRSLFKATCNCVFYIGGDPIENVDSFQHLGHIITSGLGDEEDVLNRRNSFFGQVNNVLCFFGKLDWFARVKLFKAYCTSMYGCELWSLSSVVINEFCTAWRKGLRRVMVLPYNTHNYFLPLLADTIPIFDELCKRTARFINSCLFSKSSLVRAIAWQGVVLSRCDSVVGRNAIVCCDRYGWGLSEFALGTIDLSNVYFVRNFRNYVTDVELSRTLTLFELIAIREGFFNLSFADNVGFSRTELQYFLDFFATA